MLAKDVCVVDAGLAHNPAPLGITLAQGSVNLVAGISYQPVRNIICGRVWNSFEPHFIGSTKVFGNSARVVKSTCEFKVKALYPRQIPLKGNIGLD
ncbi:hypothetical protein SDC9_100824 [bioreactor metagenome]|uniref:Uncharacterized protein n=1 Tax=bioreactor metagenome TaxID=1076179 RepID=A0A645AP26_9ZZZZ